MSAAIVPHQRHYASTVWVPTVVTAPSSGRPSVSTSRCRFTPLIFFLSIGTQNWTPVTPPDGSIFHAENTLTPDQRSHTGRGTDNNSNILPLRLVSSLF